MDGREKAGWLADKICNGGDYAKEAAIVLVRQAEEIDRLRQVARNTYEVWAGSEGIPRPETAAEAYLLRLVEKMRDEAKNGLRNG